MQQRSVRLRAPYIFGKNERFLYSFRFPETETIQKSSRFPRDVGCPLMKFNKSFQDTGVFLDHVHTLDYVIKTCDFYLIRSARYQPKIQFQSFGMAFRNFDAWQELNQPQPYFPQLVDFDHEVVAPSVVYSWITSVTPRYIKARSFKFPFTH